MAARPARREVLPPSWSATSTSSAPSNPSHRIRTSAITAAACGTVQSSRPVRSASARTTPKATYAADHAASRHGSCAPRMKIGSPTITQTAAPPAAMSLRSSLGMSGAYAGRSRAHIGLKDHAMDHTSGRCGRAGPRLRGEQGGTHMLMAMILAAADPADFLTAVRALDLARVGRLLEDDPSLASARDEKGSAIAAALGARRGEGLDRKSVGRERA